jgi:hypothetical protein
MEHSCQYQENREYWDGAKNVRRFLEKCILLRSLIVTNDCSKKQMLDPQGVTVLSVALDLPSISILLSVHEDDISELLSNIRQLLTQCEMSLLSLLPVQLIWIFFSIQMTKLLVACSDPCPPPHMDFRAVQCQQKLRRRSAVSLSDSREVEPACSCAVGGRVYFFQVLMWQCQTFVFR